MKANSQLNHPFRNEIDDGSIHKATKSTMKLKNELKECTIMNKDLISKIQEDFRQSENLITKLKDEKNKLKDALADTLHKKDELYSKMLEYREELTREKRKNQDLLGKLGEIEGIKLHIHDLNLIMSSKEQQYENIIKENNTLRAQLAKQEIEATSWKELYEANKVKDSSFTSAANEDNGGWDIDIINVWNVVMRKLHIDSDLYDTFKKNASGLSYFSELLENGKWKEALYRNLCFLNDFLNPQEINSCKSVQTTEINSKPVISHKKQKTPTFVVPEIKSQQIDPEIDLAPIHDQAFPRSDTPEMIIKDREELLQSLAMQNNKLLQLNQQIYDTMSQERSSSTVSKPRSKWSNNSEESLPATKYDIYDEKEYQKINRNIKGIYDHIDNQETGEYLSSDDHKYSKNKNETKKNSRNLNKPYQNQPLKSPKAGQMRIQNSWEASNSSRRGSN
ncbi:unnamed protein product [Blepharisma stoltei]|uniref:Uncharacterized protein n=1 Tax=Blepharisma stoltei TaxID=1481888 RepID=A0AAU9IQ40_9CILI|nr:unnamed protein product [Blepharisma stoltei]